MKAKNRMMETRGRKGGGVGYKVKLGGMDMVHNFTVSSGAVSSKEHPAKHGDKMAKPKGHGK